jgi:peptide chain release factor 1
MFESVQGLLDEHDSIQAQLGDPAVYADQKLARKLGRRSAQLNGIVDAYHKWHALQDDLAAAREMAAEDPDFAAEVPELEGALETAAARLTRLLIPGTRTMPAT